MKSSIWFRIVAALVLYIPCGSAHAKQNPSSNELDKLDNIRVSLNVADGSLASAIASISAQVRITIVADDLPRANPAPFMVNGSAMQVLADVCNRFDYSWRKTTAGDIILTKRFKNPAEHPQFDKNEAADIAARIVRIFRRLPTVPDPHAVGPTLQSLYGSLSQQQFNQSRSNNPLRVADLAPAQQQLVTAAVIHDAFGKVLAHWDVLESQLSTLDQSKIERVISTQPLDSSRQPDRPSMNRFVYCWDRAGRTCRAVLPHYPSGYAEYPHISTPPLTDVSPPSDLSSASFDAIRKPVRVKAGRTSVGELAEHLAQATGVRIDVPSGLKNHVMALAAENAGAARILDMVCDMGGWQWYPTGPDSITLTYPKHAPIKTIEDVFAAVRGAMPPSWVRFLAYVPDDDNAIVANPNSSKSQILKQIGVYEATTGMRERNRQIGNLTSEYCSILTKNLMQTDGASIPYASLSPDKQQALITCLVLDTLHRFCSASSGAGGIIHKQLLPYQRDPMSAVVITDDRGISIYSLIDQAGAHGRMGFGASLIGPGK